jgi:hypothetical protein
MNKETVEASRKEPPWSMSNAVANPALPYSASIIGKPRNEVLANPATRMRQPVTPFSQPYFFPRDPNNAHEQRKVSHAAEMGRSSCQERTSGGRWSKASTGNTK